MAIFRFVFFLFVGAAIALQVLSSTPATEPVEKERAYYIRNGGVWCAKMEYTPCGIRLSKCASTMIYECLQDVSYEDKP